MHVFTQNIVKSAPRVENPLKLESNKSSFFYTISQAISTREVFLNPKFLDHEPLYEPTLEYKSHSSQLHTHHAEVCAPIVGTSNSTCNFGCWIDSEIASSD